MSILNSQRTTKIESGVCEERAMAAPVNATEMSTSNMTKSITRLLQHSILQLCNDHIGYNHKLQILGVLCMTVDDEQQEMVVKVNNTLKRVNPVSSASKAECNPVTPYSSQLQASQTPGGLASPSISEGVSNSSGSAGELSNSSSARRGHGRKGNHPVKVLHQVFEDGGMKSDDEDDMAAVITVIPEAPEATALQQTGGMTLQHSPPTAASAPPTALHQLMGATNGANHSRITGSAKRKPSHQYRVPQSPSSSSATNLKAEFFEDLGQTPEVSPAISSGSIINVPAYVPGAYSNKLNGTSEEQPSNGLDLSVSGKDSKPAKGNNNMKKEPKDFDYNQALDLSGSEDMARSQNHLNNLMAAAFGTAASTSELLKLKGGELLPPYAGLNLLAMAGHNASSPNPDPNGLYIKYTSNGPYTVGANGQDVSNSSRIKDVMVFDNGSPQQKGTKIESDYIVDKLGMDGRKRRRRAPEDQLTPEEIAEYLGDAEKELYSFKCKYCSDEFDNVTRYIHHSLAAHQAYICHQCGKSFTTKSSLLRHRPIHTGMRRFACSICKKTFYRKDKCKAHIKRHLGLEANGDTSRSEDHIEPAPISLQSADSPASSTDLSQPSSVPPPASSSSDTAAVPSV